MAKCLLCEKETENELQICDECQKAQEVEKTEVSSNVEELKPRKVAGRLSLIFGLIAIIYMFFGGIINNILSWIPIVSWIVSFISAFAPVIILGFAITAIVLGCKAKNTVSNKIGKAGKALGIVVLVVYPILVIVRTIFIILFIVLLFAMLLLLLAPTILIEILYILVELFALNPEFIEGLEDIFG